MTKKAMSEDEAAFRAKIKEAPKDSAPKGVFADWLDEQGRHFEAEVWRAEAGLQFNLYGIQYLAPSDRPYTIIEPSVGKLAYSIRLFNKYPTTFPIQSLALVPLRPASPVKLNLGDFKSFRLGRKITRADSTMAVYKHATKDLFSED